MDLRRLKAFVTIAEQGSVSAASRHLGIAQPALSRHVAALEAEFGLELFHRIRRRLLLTKDGARFLNECRKVLGAAEALRDAAKHLQGTPTGVLRVAATPQTMEGVFSKFLAVYALRCPGVEVRLTEAVGREPLQRLERGDIDLVVSFEQVMEVEKHQFARFTLPALDFLAAAAQAKPFETEDIDVTQLAKHKLLLFDRSFAVRAMFDAACQLAGVEASIFFESRAPHTLLSFAEQGHGIAIIPSVVPTGGYKLNLARVTYRGEPLRGLFTIFSNKHRALPAYAEQFCESLRIYMERIFPISAPTRRTGKKKRSSGRRRRLNR